MLFAGVLVLLFLAYSSFTRIIALRGTSNIVIEEEQKLARLQAANEALKRDLEYKKSERFMEEEIRNKLGLAKEGEEVVVVTEDYDKTVNPSTSLRTSKKQIPNWKKWQILVFGRV